MLNCKIESMRETRKLDFTNISFSIKKIKTKNRIINIISNFDSIIHCRVAPTDRRQDFIFK